MAAAGQAHRADRRGASVPPLNAGRLIHATTSGIPHTPHYLILNTAIGGAWPGNPDSTTVLPQDHDIDYVRVHQREGGDFRR